MAEHRERESQDDAGSSPDRHALSHVLDRLESAAQGDKVSVEKIVQKLGRRSFPALILIPALLAVSPASGIPGFTSAVGLLVTVTAAQMLFGRDCAWFPEFLSKRTIPSERLRTSVRWLRRPVDYVERISRPRLLPLVTRPLVKLPVLVMLCIGIFMPLLEIIPTSGSIAAALISVYAIGLLMRDGALVVLGFALTAVAPIAIWQFTS